jgi:hypothetical protein
MLAPLPEPRESLEAVSLLDGRILAAGGSQTFYEADPGSGVYQGRGHLSNTVFVYDPQTNGWRSRPDLELGGYPRLIRLSDGRVMGLGPRCGTIDERLIRWSAIPCPAYRHIGGAFVPLPDGRLVAVGGTGQSQATPMTAAELWNPKTTEWTAITSMNAGRDDASGATLSDGRIVIGGPPASGIEIWSPVTGTWSVDANMHEPVARVVSGTGGEGVLIDTLNAASSRLWLWRPNRR